MTKTIIHNSTELPDIKYELTDTSEKENSSENEIDFDDEKISFNLKKLGNTSNINLTLSYFLSSQLFSNLNLDIQVPPPRIQYHNYI